MEHEYQVLTHLQENELTTQRKISKRTGLSLGAVNLLLKKMVRKGLIKIERLNARTMRYILTPKGLQEKSRLTYRYIRNSYKQIIKINQVLDHILAEYAAGREEAIILFGPSDEVLEILTRHLKNNDVAFELVTDPGALRKLDPAGKRLVLIWREEEEALSGPHRALNIMKML